MDRNFWMDKRIVVAFAVSLLTLAEIVDLTIVSVALPDIMGALGANLNEISLTMTSYIVASAIFIPLTGILSKKFGCKFLILVSTFIFGMASVLCGLSTNVAEMVFFRILQGIGGAFLPAVAQAYIFNSFTVEERPKIMTFYSSCVVMGPVIGPIFGGLIVEHLNWSWIFYVNVPICLLGFGLVYFLMDETKLEKVTFDYLSFIFLFIAVGCLEFFLDEGNINNWFESKLMVVVFSSGVLFLIFFIWRGCYDKSVIDFRLFKHWNFILSSIIVFLFMIIAIMAMAYFPTLLQQGYGYPVGLSGLVTSPRGIVAFLAAPFFMYLGRKIDPRLVVSIGLSIFAFSCYILCLYGAQYSPVLIILAVALQGIGLVGTFVVLSQLVFTNLDASLTNDASGIFNFFRNIGTSVGTSIAATIISRQQQTAWNDMGAHIKQHNLNFQKFLQDLGHIPIDVKVQLLSLQVKGQAFFIANLDLFFLSLIGALCIIWMPFFLAKPQKISSNMHVMH